MLIAEQLTKMSIFTKRIRPLIHFATILINNSEPHVVPRPARREGEHDSRRVPRAHPHLGGDLVAKLHGHAHGGGLPAVHGE